MSEKERYATIGTWVEVFRKEGIEVNKETIRSRIKQAEIIGVMARDRLGRVLTVGFYSESDVRSAVADLIQNTTRADAQGFITQGGETYGTIGVFEKFLGIPKRTIALRIRGKVVPIRAKNVSGRVCDFYPLSGIRSLCEELTEQMPQAGEDNTFEIGGVHYVTIECAAQSIGISARSVLARIKASGLVPLRGKSKLGRVFDYYPLSEIQLRCSGLTESLPQIDEKGLFEKNGETYGTIHSLSRLLGISFRPVHSRITKSTLRAISGKDKGNNVWNFYPLAEVRRLCADLVQELPQADKSGTFEQGGEIYGTIYSLSHLLGISPPTITRKIRKNSFESIKGKDAGGRVFDFYSVSKVQTLCADLIAKYKKE